MFKLSETQSEDMGRKKGGEKAKKGGRGKERKVNGGKEKKKKMDRYVQKNESRES